MQEALPVFARLKLQWKTLLTFFDQMATNIETAMGEPMQSLCKTSKSVSRFETNAKITLGRDLMFDAVRQSSSMSLIIQKQAGLYHDVSE